MKSLDIHNIEHGKYTTCKYGTIHLGKCDCEDPEDNYEERKIAERSAHDGMELWG